MRPYWIAFAWLSLISNNLFADTVAARCDIYPSGSDHIDKMLPCDFSQRQGFVHIVRSDGIEYSLRPYGDKPGNYTDAQNRPAYRQSGLGKLGHIYRLADESVYVYWNTAALYPPEGKDNPTYPFTTREFDATSLFRCHRSGESEVSLCSAGINRISYGRAEIHIRLPSSETAVFVFNNQFVTSQGHAVSWQMENDTWKLLVDGELHIDVPRAAIEGN